MGSGKTDLAVTEDLCRASALAVRRALDQVRRDIRGPVSLADEAIMAGAAAQLVQMMVQAFGPEVATARLKIALEQFAGG